MNSITSRSVHAKAAMVVATAFMALAGIVVSYYITSTIFNQPEVFAAQDCTAGDSRVQALTQTYGVQPRFAESGRGGTIVYWDVNRAGKQAIFQQLTQQGLTYLRPNNYTDNAIENLIKSFTSEYRYIIIEGACNRQQLLSYNSEGHRLSKDRDCNSVGPELQHKVNYFVIASNAGGVLQDVAFGGTVTLGSAGERIDGPGDGGDGGHVAAICVPQQAVPVACSTAADCGNSGFIGGPFCQTNSVFRNYVTYTCNNPGTAQSYCSNLVAAQLQQVCPMSQTCSNGSCLNTGNFCASHASQRCVNNAVYWFDSCGNQQDLYSVCTGSQVCSNNVCVNQVTVVGNLSVTTQVRNLSSGNLTWASSAYANPSDVIQYNVIIQASSSQAVNNVTVRDVLPANLIYNNALTLDGVSNSGNITLGMNIGAINAGQTRAIAYQAQVAGSQNFPFGSTTLTNAVNVTSTDPGFTSVASSAPVVVTRSGVLGATTVATGLTNNIWFDSFFIPLALALIGLWLYKSGILNSLGIAKWFGSKKLQGRIITSQGALEKRIAQIRKSEGR